MDNDLIGIYKIVNKINEISQMRMNLYSNLQNSYSFYQQNVSSSRNTLEEQSAAVGIVEQELNEAGFIYWYQRED